MTTATEIMLKQQAGQQMLNRFLETAMEVRPLKGGVEQTVRTYIRAFQVQNGVHARHIYLPTEVFDLFTDYMEEQMEAQGLNQTAIEQITRYWYLGVEVHNTNGYDIIVTRDPLP